MDGELWLGNRGLRAVPKGGGVNDRGERRFSDLQPRHHRHASLAATELPDEFQAYG